MENKIPFYNIVNMLLTGLIFSGILIILFAHDIVDLYQNLNIKEFSFAFITIITFSFFAIIYEVGMIVNRLGSLLEEPLKYFKLIPFDNDYKKFNERKKEYPILSTLSREYSLSRTSIMLFLIIAILTFIKLHYWGFLPLAICLLFYFSCRKYAKKIIALMN